VDPEGEREEDNPEACGMTRPFTAREREVAALIAASRTTKQIAAYLTISEERVLYYIRSLAEKADVDRSGDIRVALALWWREQAA
jgi:DNA-binding CsgD family transcriptional regulator